MAKARTNVLSTSTINYLELIGNGKAYRVPPYQRDYAWTEEEWEDLWNDVLDLRQENEGRHYMGALVVQGESDREFTIIDGQQRLATISILSLAVIAKLHRMADREIDAERNRERAKELRNRFVGEKDPASLIESSRLNLSLTDDAFYQDYLVQLREPPNPRGLPQSNSLLWRCFRYFSERLEVLDDLEEDGEALARVLSETTARCLLFILIKVEDELDAYTVFETLERAGAGADDGGPVEELLLLQGSRSQRSGSVAAALAGTDCYGDSGTLFGLSSLPLSLRAVGRAQGAAVQAGTRAGEHRAARVRSPGGAGTPCGAVCSPCRRQSRVLDGTRGCETVCPGTDFCSAPDRSPRFSLPHGNGFRQTTSLGS